MTIAVNTNAVSNTNNDTPIDVNSIQMAFALMQMELAKEHKESAKSLIEQVKANQGMSKRYAANIAALNGLQKGVLDKYTVPGDLAGLDRFLNNAEEYISKYKKLIDEVKAGKATASGKSDGADTYAFDTDTYNKLSSMTRELGKGNFEHFCRGDDNHHTLAELKGGLDDLYQLKHYFSTLKESLNLGLNSSIYTSGFQDQTLSKMVTSLQGLQEEYGTKNQTLMVQIQDLLGQYNANVQGANSAVQQSNNVTQQLARGG